MLYKSVWQPFLFHSVLLLEGDGIQHLAMQIAFVIKPNINGMGHFRKSLNVTKIQPSWISGRFDSGPYAKIKLQNMWISQDELCTKTYQTCSRSNVKTQKLCTKSFVKLVFMVEQLQASLLSPSTITCRMKWCKSHHHWTPVEMCSVAWWIVLLYPEVWWTHQALSPARNCIVLSAKSEGEGIMMSVSAETLLSSWRENLSSLFSLNFLNFGSIFMDVSFLFQKAQSVKATNVRLE